MRQLFSKLCCLFRKFVSLFSSSIIYAADLAWYLLFAGISDEQGRPWEKTEHILTQKASVVAVVVAVGA